MSEKIKVNVNDVYAMLKDGKTRKEIAEHYGVSLAAARKTFLKHPKLKNVKTAKDYNIEVIDPEEENADAVNAEREQSEERANEIPAQETEAEQEQEEDAPTADLDRSWG